MSDFQLYIVREREAYLKGLNDNSPMNHSHLCMPENPLLYGGDGKSSFIGGGIASLQNSGYNAMRRKDQLQ